ncbi:MAG: crossover junction endodeoxyribonuclease RuvC [Planctomycetota bacterium]|nr:crossover junction endodeoxyribonuclease RuvC [Planctomycetota bacterium]
MRYLGIDPGTQWTGYAVLDCDGSELDRVTSGVFDLRKEGELSRRLAVLHEKLTALAAEFEPCELAVEKVFFGLNAKSALALGHGRGVILSVAGARRMPVFEYAPATVKKAVTGRGRATKDQVIKMVSYRLGGYASARDDEADALAVAMCHSHRKTANGLIS